MLEAIHEMAVQRVRESECPRDVIARFGMHRCTICGWSKTARGRGRGLQANGRGKAAPPLSRQALACSSRRHIHVPERFCKPLSRRYQDVPPSMPDLEHLHQRMAGHRAVGRGRGAARQQHVRARVQRGVVDHAIGCIDGDQHVGTRAQP